MYHIGTTVSPFAINVMVREVFVLINSIVQECFVPLLVYGWMKDIALDLQSAEPLTSIDSSEGNELLLYVYFTRNGPSHTDDFLFTIHTSGTAQGLLSPYVVL